MPPNWWEWDPQCPSQINDFGNSTLPPTPNMYPKTWNETTMREQVYPICFYIGGMVYTFFAIAIICDEFFVPALERICEKFPITPDVAGATLMAAGGSAPELATSFIGTSFKSQVGFGTIVGSAVFNVLFVIGACAFVAPEALKLDWWPLFRDSFYYSISLVVLMIFFGYVSKNRIFWYESLILFLLYILYVILMSQNEKLEKSITGAVDQCRKRKKKEPPIHPEPGAEEKKSIADKEMTKTPQEVEDSPELEKKQLLPPREIEAGVVNDEATSGDNDNDEEGSDDDDDEGPFELTWPTQEAFLHEEKYPNCKLTFAQVSFILLMPLNALFYFTVPDVRREDSTICGIKVVWKNMWLPAFAMSIIWIGAFSFFMVWWAELVGLATGLPSVVLGLTILAPATSIPDLLSSMLVARKGEGNMAVSSSIGSNIFDILVGLPIPWFVFSLAWGAQDWGKCVTPDGAFDNHFCFSVPVTADTLLFSVFVLVMMIVIVISAVHVSGWKMTKGLGITMFGLYVLFVVQDLLRHCDVVPATARFFMWLG